MLIFVRIIFFVLDERLTDDINGRPDTTEKKFSINLVKAETKFYLSLH